MKKTIGKLASLVLVLIMVIGVLANPVFAAKERNFSDVAASKWYYGYVLMLAEKDIVGGFKGTNEFRPDNKVTREQASKMIALAAGINYEGKVADFKDVNKKGWASPFIAALEEEGVVKGFGKTGEFRPGNNIQRGHSAKMVAKAFGLDPGSLERTLNDLPADADVSLAIETLASNGIVKGYKGSGDFKPAEEISRAEISKILCVAMVVSSIQDAEADPTLAKLDAAQTLIDQLPKDQDTDTLEYLLGRLDTIILVKHIDVIDSRTLRVRLSDLSNHIVELDEDLVDGIAKEVNFEINGIPYTATVIWNQSSEPGGPAIENVIDKTITLNLAAASGEARTGQYTGDLVDGLPHGYGSFSTVNPEGSSWTYEGEWQEGEFEGEGSVTWDNGSKKSGTFNEGILNGKGKEIYVGDDFTISYEGDYVNDFYHGYGIETYITSDGYSSIYEGNWENGLKNGKGKEIQSDGTIYEGDFVDGGLHGQGKIIMPDGTIYEGNFVDYELVDGQIDYSSGLTYRGELRDYLYHGQGILYDYHDEIVYSGSFANGYISQSASARASRINEIKAKSESYSVYDLKEYCEANEHQYCEVWGQVINVEEYGNGSAWIQINDQGIDSKDRVISIEYQMSVGETLPELWDYIDVWGTTQYMYDYESVGGFYMNTPLLYGLVIETW